MAWHRKNGANLLLRASGAMLLALSYLCGDWLRARAAAGPIDGDPLAFMLAAATFLSASGGSLLVILGTHIFDQVEVAFPWYRIGRAVARDRNGPR